MNKASLPKISIVTPSYNQGDYVETTVKSVFGQRYPNLEYIFMDGGSKDHTIKEITPFIDKFAYFQSAPDGGQSAAIARGFEISTGDILAYLNSDDVLLPGTLNFVANYFADNPGVDLIYGHRCFINELDRVTGHWILPGHSNFLMRRWDLIPQETCFWRRRLYNQGGNVDPAFRFAMDYDLFVRYMNIGKVRRVNRFLAAFRVHENAKTTNLYDTVGKAEIKRIHEKYNIRLIPYLGHVFLRGVQLKSALWLRSKNSLPGLPPGAGFDIKTLFG